MGVRVLPVSCPDCSRLIDALPGAEIPNLFSHLQRVSNSQLCERACCLTFESHAAFSFVRYSVRSHYCDRACAGPIGRAGTCNQGSKKPGLVSRADAVSGELLKRHDLGGASPFTSSAGASYDSAGTIHAAECLH